MKGLLQIMALLCATLAVVQMHAQVTHFVKSGGTCTANCTTSFSGAYSNLQDALSAASNGDKILVAEGTYTPTTGSTRTIAFNIPNGVSLYGGFEGVTAETLYTQSQPDLYETILSGEIGSAGNSDNSYNVVTVNSNSANVILHGFTIRDGNANNILSSTYSIGGGLSYNNSANSGDLNISYCRFEENSAVKAGGGLYASYGDINLDRCQFTNNCQTGIGTSSDSGGGACFFWSNSTTMNATISNCLFSGNTMVYRAAIAIRGAWGITIYNSVFSSNTNIGLLSLAGGAVHLWDGDNCKIVNCTFVKNELTVAVGNTVITCHSSNTSNLDVTNSIFWGNIPSGYHPITPKANDVQYCDIQNFSSWTGPTGSTTGSIGLDPLFVTTDYQLSAFSPCTDAGLDAAITSLTVYDKRGMGFARNEDVDCAGANNVDMGAFEVQSDENQLIYVSCSGGGGNGYAWSSAFQNLQLGIALAHDCHAVFCDPNPVIWVEEGTYTPGYTSGDAFAITENMSIYGGFEGNEVDFSERPTSYTVNPTILSGYLGGGNHALHIFTLDNAELVADGFYITEADAAYSSGGGFYVFDNARLNLSNTEVYHNLANEQGAAIYAAASDVYCEDVYFNANQAAYGGAIAATEGCSLTIATCSFESNAASVYGGGIFAGASALFVSIENTEFILNEAAAGGALHLTGVTGWINSGLFESNETTSSGGAAYIESSELRMDDVQIKYNSSAVGGAMCINGSALTVRGATFEMNTADAGGAIAINNNCSVVISNSRANENASTGNGGFITTLGSSDVYIGNLYAIGNTAGSKGAVFGAEADNANYYIANVVGMCNIAEDKGHIYYSGPYDTYLEIYFGSFYKNTHPDGWSSPHTVIETQSTLSIASTIVNSIFYDNQTRTFCDPANLVVDFTNTDGLLDCDGNFITSPYPGLWNEYADPMFIDADGTDNIFCTQDDHLRLDGDGTGSFTDNSVCIDAGTILAVPLDFADVDNDGVTYGENLPIDIEGNPRVDDGIYNSEPDMGAYENDGSYKHNEPDKKEERAYSLSVMVFPNPATKQVTVCMDQAIQDIRLTDLLGKPQPIQITISHTKAELSLANLSPGIYLIEISQGGKKFYFKLEKILG